MENKDSVRMKTIITAILLVLLFAFVGAYSVTLTLTSPANTTYTNPNVNLNVTTAENSSNVSVYIGSGEGFWTRHYLNANTTTVLNFNQTPIDVNGGSNITYHGNRTWWGLNISYQDSDSVTTNATCLWVVANDTAPQGTVVNESMFLSTGANYSFVKTPMIVVTQISNATYVVSSGAAGFANFTTYANATIQLDPTNAGTSGIANKTYDVTYRWGSPSTRGTEVSSSNTTPWASVSSTGGYEYYGFRCFSVQTRRIAMVNQTPAVNGTVIGLRKMQDIWFNLTTNSSAANVSIIVGNLTFPKGVEWYLSNTSRTSWYINLTNPFNYTTDSAEEGIMNNFSFANHAGWYNFTIFVNDTSLNTSNNKRTYSEILWYFFDPDNAVFSKNVNVSLANPENTGFLNITYNVTKTSSAIVTNSLNRCFVKTYSIKTSNVVGNNNRTMFYGEITGNITYTNKTTSGTARCYINVSSSNVPEGRLIFEEWVTDAGGNNASGRNHTNMVMNILSSSNWNFLAVQNTETAGIFETRNKYIDYISVFNGTVGNATWGTHATATSTRPTMYLNYSAGIYVSVNTTTAIFRNITKENLKDMNVTLYGNVWNSVTTNNDSSLLLDIGKLKLYNHLDTNYTITNESITFETAGTNYSFTQTTVNNISFFGNGTHKLTSADYSYNATHVFLLTAGNLSAQNVSFNYSSYQYHVNVTTTIKYLVYINSSNSTFPSLSYRIGWNTTGNPQNIELVRGRAVWIAGNNSDYAKTIFYQNGTITGRDN